MIEPLAILAIGLIVGVTVLAMFLPLISLVQGLS
jgi:type II secretory pathway component PulF